METSASRRYAALFVALSLLPWVTGCDSDSPTAPTLPEGPVTPVEIYRATTSGLVDSERRLVREQSAYDALIDDIFGDDPNPPMLADVDFDQNMVIAVASGEEPEACRSISITEGQADGTDLSLTVTEVDPPTGCGCDLVPSQPVQVVEVPRADEVFFATVSITACPG